MTNEPLQIEDLKAQIIEAEEKTKSLAEQVYQAAPSLPENISREVHDLNTLVKKKPKKEAGDTTGNGLKANGHSEPTLNGKRRANEGLTKETSVEEAGFGDKRTKIDG